MDKVLNSCVIFQNKTSDGNNAFTISSPHRAARTSLLCGCLLISNLTPQRKETGLIQIPDMQPAEGTNALVLLQHRLSLGTLVAVL